MGTLLFPNNAGNTDPSFLGQQALSTMRDAGTLDVFGNALNTVSNTSAMLYRSQVASNNAKIEEQNARAAEASGRYASEVRQIEGGKVEASQKAGFAGGNIDVGSAGVQNVLRGTEQATQADTLAIQYNAAREAYAARMREAEAKAESSLDKTGAMSAAFAGAGATYGSYLSTSSALSNKALQLRQYGVNLG